MEQIAILLALDEGRLDGLSPAQLGTFKQLIGSELEDLDETSMTALQQGGALDAGTKSSLLALIDRLVADLGAAVGGARQYG